MSYPIYRLAETVPPAAEPLDLAEIKTFLRIDHANDDGLVANLISTARQLCESATGRSLITRSYSLYLDRWPGTASSGWWDGVREGADAIVGDTVLRLPRAPLLSVTRVNVYDADNAATEFLPVNYFADTAGSPGRIVIAGGASPPVPGRAANGIEIQFIAGYGAAAQNVPVMLRQGMKQVIAHLYEHRGDNPDQALAASGAALLFHPYRTMSIS